MKKNLLSFWLMALMVMLGGMKAWAGDKTVVKYSFDDANSPSLTAGSRVSFDYDKTSVITSTKFLNAWNNTNGDPGATTVSLGSTDLSGETWTLSFEWAAVGGCNSKPDHTTLKAGDTNLLDISGNSNWNTTVTLTYLNSDGTKTLPVPGCNKSYRFTAATGNQLNTTDYWHHFVITGGTDGVKLTITNSSTGAAVVENVVLSETNVNPTSLILEPCCGGAIGIDELSLTYYVEGEVIQTPIANYTLVDGINRTITATCDTEGAALYYSLDGENWTEGAVVTVSESGNVYFKAVMGSSESDVLTFEAVAGEAITLNAPLINRTSNTSVTITADQTNLLLSPDATITYEYGNEKASFTGSKTLAVTVDAVIAAYAEFNGYTTSETTELAVALFPEYVTKMENTATKTSGWSANAFSEETVTASERTYAALLLDDAQWGENIYLQTDGAWGLRYSGNWYINSDTQESWLLMQNMKKGDIIVVNVTYPASSTVNATYSKYSFGTQHAYEVTEDGNVELAFKKINAQTMDYLYGVYSYRPMSEEDIEAAKALAEAKAQLQTAIENAKALEIIESTDPETGDITYKENGEAVAKAIADAEAALVATDATVESLAAAALALQTAVNTFNGAPGPVYAKKTIVLYPGVWAVDNATFAAYVWNDEGNKWFPFIPANGIDGAYGTQIPENYTGLILARINPSGTDPDPWKNVWNQTDDIDFTAIADQTIFTITGWGEGGGNSTYTAGTALDIAKAALQDAIDKVKAFNLAGLAEAIATAKAALTAEGATIESLQAAGATLEAAVKAYIKESLATAIPMIESLNVEALADAINTAKAAVANEEATVEDLAGAMFGLLEPARPYIITILGQTVEICKPLGVDTSVAEALLSQTDPEAATTELASALLNLAQDAIPAIQVVLANLKEYMTAFSSEAAAAMKEDFEKLESDIANGNIVAVKDDIVTLMANGKPYLQVDVAKLEGYAEVLNNETITADVAAMKAAVEAGSFTSLLAAVEKFKADFLAFAPGFVNQIEFAAAGYKDAGKTIGIDQLEEAIANAKLAVQAEDKTIVSVGMAVRNLILALQAYIEANSTYTVAGTNDLTGTEVDWQVVEANNMTFDAESGLYTWTAENITVNAENQPQFKVVITNIDGNQTWIPASEEGNDHNWIITTDVVGGEGVYNITITYDAKTQEIGVIPEKQVEPVVDPSIIYSWESPEGTVIQTGGTIEYVNGDGDRLNYFNNDNYTICLNGKKANLNDETASANAGHMVITLDNALAEGDIIEMTAYVNKNESKKSSAYIVFENGTAVEGEIYSDESNIDPAFNGVPTTKITLVPAEAAGSKTITLTRSQTQTNLFITKLVIKKASEPELNTYTATFTTNAGWEKAYAYAWTDDGESAVKFLGEWPGTEMTPGNGDNDWMISFKAENAPEKIIFSNGAGAQTEDLAFEDGKAYEFKISDEWAAAIAAAKALAEEDGVAVGKLLAAISVAQGQTGTDDDKTALQAAVDQYKADNADQEKDETAKVATNGWKKFDGSNAGVCATQFAPAITTYDGRKDVQLAEVYETTVETTGTIIYQDITGLTNGKYKAGFYGNAFFTSGRGFDSTMEDGATDVAYVFANDQKEFITARIATETTENDFRTFDVEVTDGTIKLGMGKEKAGTNWHTMQIYQLTWFATAKEVFAADQVELKALLAEANALLADETKTEGREGFEIFVKGAELAVDSKMINIAELEAVIGNLKSLIAGFKKANWYIDFAAGEYYIIDAESGLMMAAGHNYGTRGIVNETGLDLTLTPHTESRTVTIDSRVSNGGNSHFLGSNLYMDSSEWGWALEYQGFGFYILEPDGGKYINVDKDNNLVLSDTPREFIIVTKDGVMEERMNELKEATAEKPVDATFLLQNPNFNRNDQRVEAWTFIPGETAEENPENWNNHNFNGGNQVNNCAESYHALFTAQQVIKDAPAGIYKLTAQGFFRQDTYEGDAPAAPVFFIGTATGAVPVKTGEENSMSAASESFTAGQYTIDAIEYKHYGGDLVVGVQSFANTQWVIFDNFQLSYCGTFEIESYTVAGAYKLDEMEEAAFFTEAWNPALEANDLVKGDDGIYTKTYENVELTPGGTILYKVVADHSWTLNWGFGESNADYYVNLPEGKSLPEGTTTGVFNVTFKFNPTEKFENGFNVDCEVEYDEETTTGIASVKSEKDYSNDAIYTLNGQRVEKPRKGLYIVNGKKMVVK